MMDAVDLHAEAWDGIKNGFESGRLAHAYVIVGSPRGNALSFAESFLKLLFCASAEKPCNGCAGCRKVEGHKHVDTLWLEPQSKSRQITTEDVHGLIQRMTRTSFEGGWKAGVILCADRMNVASENALLKTLEEPPPKSLLLLVTDSAESLLPTIISRCQKITLSEGKAGAMDAVWSEPLMSLLRDLPPSSGRDAARSASRLKGLFDRVKDGIANAVAEEFDEDDSLDESKIKAILEARTNARLKEVQADVFRVMLDWHRDVLLLASGINDEKLVFGSDVEALASQAKLHSQGSALNAARVIDEMAARLDRNIPAAQVLDEAFRKLSR